MLFFGCYVFLCLTMYLICLDFPCALLHGDFVLFFPKVLQLLQLLFLFLFKKLFKECCSISTYLCWHQILTWWFQVISLIIVKVFILIMFWWLSVGLRYNPLGWSDFNSINVILLVELIIHAAFSISIFTPLIQSCLFSNKNHLPMLCFTFIRVGYFILFFKE